MSAHPTGSPGEAGGMSAPGRGGEAGFSTRAIHAGQDPDPATGATITPIYATSVFTYPEIDRPGPYDYGRHGNPTRTALETCLAALEGARHAVAFASGMAAIDAVFRALLRSGDRLLLAEDVYGGTVRLAEEVFRPAGVDVACVDARDTARLEEALAPGARLVWIESPTNPLVRLVDIAACAEAAHRAGALLGVDSTFATPFLQNPLSLGADLVMHSTTKYLGGHSDLVGGAVAVNDPSLFDRLAALSRVAGAIPSPFDCWLALRGVKTLALRMREHGRGAMEVAGFLQGHPAVARVHYPGLESHPQHELARRQMRGYGGMIAADVAGGAVAARAVLNGVRLFTLTGSLGGVESILSWPARMSHVALSPEERARRGIGDGLLRLSIGLEDPADLMDDLSQALGRVSAA